MLIIYRKKIIKTFCHKMFGLLPENKFTKIFSKYNWEYDIIIRQPCYVIFTSKVFSPRDNFVYCNSRHDENKHL